MGIRAFLLPSGTHRDKCLCGRLSYLRFDSTNGPYWCLLCRFSHVLCFGDATSMDFDFGIEYLKSTKQFLAQGSSRSLTHDHATLNGMKKILITGSNTRQGIEVGDKKGHSKSRWV